MYERFQGSNLFKANETKMEDIWQGKAALVLKVGPDAFVDDATQSFAGSQIEVGDWVAFKVGNAWMMNIRGVPCRLIEDTQIRMKLKDPSILEVKTMPRIRKPSSPAIMADLETPEVQPYESKLKLDPKLVADAAKEEPTVVEKREPVQPPPPPADSHRNI
jgi:hypothetical protein